MFLKTKQSCFYILFSWMKIYLFFKELSLKNYHLMTLIVFFFLWCQWPLFVSNFDRHFILILDITYLFYFKYDLPEENPDIFPERIRHVPAPIVRQRSTGPRDEKPPASWETPHFESEKKSLPKLSEGYHIMICLSFDLEFQNRIRELVSKILFCKHKYRKHPKREFYFRFDFFSKITKLGPREIGRNENYNAADYTLPKLPSQDEYIPLYKHKPLERYQIPIHYF